MTMARIQSIAGLTAGLAVSAAVAQSNIDSQHKFAWSENLGWTNWRDAGDPPASAGIRIHDGPDPNFKFLSGFIWGENFGWVDVGDGTPADGARYANEEGVDAGVNLGVPTGALFGFAWGENIGWINFNGGAMAAPAVPARIDFAANRLRGYVWGENVGWINLDDATHFVGLQAALVNVISANPPTTNPYGSGVFRDVLQNTTTALAPQGIGVAGTPGEGSYTYASVSVTFSGTPLPAPAPTNPPTAGSVTVSCMGTPQACPTVTAVSGSGAGPYTLTLSGGIPVLECTTLTFAGTSAGQKLQYQNLPGDVNVNGTTTGQDVLNLVTAINDGTSALAANLARYDMNRNGAVTGQDVLRLVQLLSGTSATQPFNGSVVAPCP